MLLTNTGAPNRVGLSWGRGFGKNLRTRRGLVATGAPSLSRHTPKAFGVNSVQSVPFVSSLFNLLRLDPHHFNAERREAAENRGEPRRTTERASFINTPATPLRASPPCSAVLRSPFPLPARSPV